MLSLPEYSAQGIQRSCPGPQPDVSTRNHTTESCVVLFRGHGVSSSHFPVRGTAGRPRLALAGISTVYIRLLSLISEGLPSPTYRSQPNLEVEVSRQPSPHKSRKRISHARTVCVCVAHHDQTVGSSTAEPLVNQVPHRHRASKEQKNFRSLGAVSMRQPRRGRSCQSQVFHLQTRSPSL